MIVLVTFFTLRVFLPAISLYFINKTLSEKLGNYTGHIRDLDLSLYKGAYQLQGLVIKKKTGTNPPLLEVKVINLSLAWPALLRKELAGDITLSEAVLQIADSEDEQKKQLGTEEELSHWQDVFSLLIPISIESFKVHNSVISFTNQDLKVPVPVRLTNIELETTDLRTKAKDVTSPFLLTAKLQETASLWVQGTADVMSNPSRGDVDFKLTNFSLSSINTVLRQYIPLDITSGTLDLFGEAITSDGRINGYVKFFFKDGDVIAPKQKYLSTKHFFAEIVSAFGNWILKNNSSKMVASRIPFDYSKKKFNISASDTFWAAVQNSFKELKPEIENSVSLVNEN